MITVHMAKGKNPMIDITLEEYFAIASIKQKGEKE